MKHVGEFSITGALLKQAGLVARKLELISQTVGFFR